MKYETRDKLKWILDNVWAGMFIGVLLPILGFLLSKVVKAPGMLMKDYWRIFVDAALEENKDIIVFSMLPSMLMFWVFFFVLKFDNASKGMVITTLFTVGVSVLLLL